MSTSYVGSCKCYVNDIHINLLFKKYVLGTNHRCIIKSFVFYTYFFFIIYCFLLEYEYNILQSHST